VITTWEPAGADPPHGHQARSDPDAVVDIKIVPHGQIETAFWTTDAQPNPRAVILPWPHCARSAEVSPLATR
jgi:hypothetical protein